MRLVSVAVLLALSCSGGDDAESAPATLAEWGLFEGPTAGAAPAEGVEPYDVIAALFMDHALKHRYMAVPEGEVIAYRDDAPWQMPLGTVIVKAFGYPIDARDPSLGERLVETRLLVREETGWRAYVYVWNDAQNEAMHARAGARVDVEWIDEAGAAQMLRYRVPNVNQCEGCHGGDGPIELLGVRTRQLDRDGQIERLASLGLFDRAPTAVADRPRFEDPFGSGDIAARARAYLDANCAHCHREGGSAESSGLWLGADISDDSALGVCRRPVAAGGGTGGLLYDVVPGDPESSILVYRMESEDPEIKMPELPSQLADTAGATLIREWIAAMPPLDCGG
jgi:uncharacterized repeat protein (TIGR03806 family)